MKIVCWLSLMVLFAPLLLAGCKEWTDEPKKSSTENPAADKSAEGQGEDPEVQAGLAKLSPEDRKLAEEQKFCAVQEDNRLGCMGTPVKVLVGGQPVFVCCKGCVKTAQSHPAQTLSRVKELKAKTGESTAP